MEITKRNNVDDILNSQRIDGEARSLLQDLEKLRSLSVERKRRWVWELIQNAKDCSSSGAKVHIVFTLTNDKLIFEHDGTPFEVENLVAIVRKTSTKSIEGLDGNTGKFGTGFVTTHVLNRAVHVSGLLKNQSGLRPFELKIDRTLETLDSLKNSLDVAFKEISIFDSQPHEENLNQKTKYVYELDEISYTIAKDGLNELKKNLPFTLLVNYDKIEAITIIEGSNNSKFSITIEPINSEFSFARININNSVDRENSIKEGLFFRKNNSLTIGLPANNNGGEWNLMCIDDQARIYRDFPLIGTENYHIPFLLNNSLFQPSEPRDGIRIKRDREDKPDKHADDNRRALLQYVEEMISFTKVLKSQNVNNLHLLAESGIPNDQYNYLDREWFIKEIQNPIRSFILSLEIVKTCSNNLIKIENAKFINTSNFEYENDFYILTSKFLPQNCPIKDSYNDWRKIISQDKEYWPDGIDISIEDLALMVDEARVLDKLVVEKMEPITWVNDLIRYLHNTGNIELSDKFSLYLNQSNVFKKRIQIKIDKNIDNRLKSISTRLNRDLFDELLSNEIENKTGISEFDVKDFFNSLNAFIGSLSVDKASNDQVKAIFDLVSIFKEGKSPKRELLYSLVSELIPDLIETKSTSKLMDDFTWESSDKWALKYVCSLIEKSTDVETFSNNFFSQNIENAFSWLNIFLNFAFSTDENKEIGLKFNVIPTQNGQFKKYDDNLFREDNPLQFEDIFKDLIKNYLEKDDPREYLIDTRIKNEFLRSKGPESITTLIDGVFNDSQNESHIEEGKKLNSFFHELNEWYGKNENLGEKLFPVFTEKRPRLTVRAFGNEMSNKVLRLIKLNKDIDQIEALAKLTLSVEELQKLEIAAQLSGGTQKLLEIAQNIFNEAEDIRWRRLVGKAAEDAFVNALNEFEPKFNIENPDIGKDFIIKDPTSEKEYYIEIKSTVIGNEIVTMSALQGQTAYQEKERYALCVISRPSRENIDKEYFVANVKFILKIGHLIGDKITKVQNGLRDISVHESGDVNITMDDKSYSVFVRKKVWEEGITFSQFIEYLNSYFKEN